MDPKLIWLATQHAVEIDGHKINVSREATSPLVRKSLTDCGRQAALGPSIIGLMRVRVAASIDCMTVLTGSEREQLRFWNGVLDKDLASAGMAYRFEVVSVAELPQPSLVEHLSSRHLRGFVAVLEEGQAPRLLNFLRAKGDLPQWVPDESHESPQVLVRLPAPYAALCAGRQWQTFLLPHCPVARFGGSSSMVIQWSTLGIRIADVPSAPRAPTGTGEMNHEIASAAADHLREYAATLDRASEFQEDSYSSVRRCVEVLQGLADQLDPAVAMRATLNARDRQAQDRGPRRGGVAGMALQFVHKDLKTDRDVVLQVVTETGMALQFARKDMKADRDVVLQAVKQTGWHCSCQR